MADPGAAGVVLSLRDEIAEVSGLADAALGERVTLADGAPGVVIALLRDRVRVELLRARAGCAPGTAVRRCGGPLQVPVGPALLGRVVDPLGTPLDGQGPLPGEGAGALGPRPTPLARRGAIREQLLTGHPAVDGLNPLGVGHATLVVGEPGTGKTRLAVGALITQGLGLPGVAGPSSGVYVGVGQTRQEAARVRERLRAAGALGRTTLVLAPAGSPAGLCGLAPLAGLAIAEERAARGERVLVVIDDLSRHAEAWQERAARLGERPGEDGLPLSLSAAQARLLDRAGPLGAAWGGGAVSVMALVSSPVGLRATPVCRDLDPGADRRVLLVRDPETGEVGPGWDRRDGLSRIAQPWILRCLRPALSARLLFAVERELQPFRSVGVEGALDPYNQSLLRQAATLRVVLSRGAVDPLPLDLMVIAITAERRGLFRVLEPPVVRGFLDALPGLLERYAPGLRGELARRGWDSRALREGAFEEIDAAVTAAWRGYCREQGWG